MMPTSITTEVSSLACAELFFKCNETLSADGSGSMVDSIRGARFKPSTSLTNVTGQTTGVYPQGTVATPLVGGSLPDFAQRSVIVFACGRIIDRLSVRVPLGDGGSPNSMDSNRGGLISLSFVGGMHALVNTSNAQIASVSDVARVLPADGTDIGIIIEYTPGVSLMAKAVDLSGVTFGSGATETILTDSSVTLADVNPGLNNITRFGGLAFYGIAAFSFTAGLPANREDAYRWMLYHHSHGNRSLPPQFVFA